MSLKKIMLRQIIQIYLLSKFINITSKGVKLVYGYKSRGHCERSPDEGEEWPEMDFYRAGITLFLDLGTLQVFLFAEIHTAVHLRSLDFSISGTSK